MTLTTTIPVPVNCIGHDYCLCQGRELTVTVTGTVADPSDMDTAVSVTSATVDGEPFELTARQVDYACECLFSDAREQWRAEQVVAKTFAEFTKLEVANG